MHQFNKHAKRVQFNTSNFIACIILTNMQKEYNFTFTKSLLIFRKSLMINEPPPFLHQLPQTLVPTYNSLES